jgi:hypothetical protein
LWGVVQGYGLMREYGLPTQLGSGGLIFAVCCAGIAIQQTRQLTGRKPPRSEHAILA